MPIPEPMPITKHLHFRTVILVISVILLTLFAVMNWNPANVWPFGNTRMLFVIVISMAFGLVIGWSARAMWHGRAITVVERD
ncbi:MAG: hypothetical protein ABJA67_09845 [Chthonomonadales bacterium]